LILILIKSFMIIMNLLFLADGAVFIYDNFWNLKYKINIYMFLRGKWNKGICNDSSYDLNSFLSVFLRKNYAEGSSTALTESIFTNISNFTML